MTNFEKIKSMTEEEFANWLCKCIIPEDTDEDMFLHGYGYFTYENDIAEMLKRNTIDIKRAEIIEQKYVLEEGKTVTVLYDDFGICKVSKECMEVLLGQYEQGRANGRAKAFDEVEEAFNEHLFDSPMINPIMTRNEILLFLKELKEQK